MRIIVNPSQKIRDPARRRDAHAGEIIDVPERHGKILIKLGKASDAPPAAPVKPMDTGNSEPIVPTIPLRRGGGGRYLRRDERAEDSE